ncbi:MAG: glycosyltransferase family 92 protein [Lachnospiraceae bacterium]|nr:glycosyltransferase family 92 protein [Lachnospiraceae bacterium]
MDLIDERAGSAMNRVAYESLCERILKRTEVFMDVLTQEEGISREFQMDWKEFFLEMKYVFQNYKELKNAAENCLIRLLIETDLINMTAVLKDSLRVSLAHFLEMLFRESQHLNEDELGFGVIVQNEARYLPEWIEYHKLIGVSRFFIYNNESSDNIEEVLEPYITEGTVTYYNWPGQAQQQIVYDHIINNYQNEVRLMGFLDADEFLLPLGEQSVLEILDDIFKKDTHVAGVGMNWLLFGSSGFEKEPEGLVIRNFLRCSEPNFDKNKFVKLICDPRQVLYPSSPHLIRYKESYYSVNEDGDRLNTFYNNLGPEGCKKLQINHYYTKSMEYWEKKKLKGGSAFYGKNTRNWGKFIVNDRNEMEDRRILKYADSVESALREKGFIA